MSYAQETGYVARSFASLMDSLRIALNAQFGMSYTAESFVGSFWYRYLYQPVQQISQIEIKTAETFVKLQAYIKTTNEKIQRPSTSLPGIIDSFAAKGWVASVRKMTEPNAGKIGVCVQVDDEDVNYPAMRLEICQFLSQFVVGGMVFDGSEDEDITLTNGQDFNFAYYLPTEKPILLKLTLTSSDNKTLSVPTDEVIRQALYDSIIAKYRLGWDFEPQIYFSTVDAPWAATILLEWSDNDGSPSYVSTVFEADFDDLITFDIEDISVLVDT